MGSSSSGRRDGDAAGHVRVEDALESEGGADGGGDLGRHVGGDVDPREVAKRGEGDGEGWVEVGPRDVARGEDYDHHAQPRTRRVPYQAFCSIVLLVYDGSC